MKTLNLVDRAVRGGWGMAAVPLALALLLASHPAHAQRMPQDSWYLAKEKPIGGTWRFAYVTDVDVGPDGNIYIADRENYRIQVISKDGKPIRSWNSKSSGVPGGDFFPAGVDAAEDGKVYVSDSGNGRLLVFSNYGKFIQVIGKKGNEMQSDLNYPQAIAVNTRIGHIYVRNSTWIATFDLDGNFIRNIGSSEMFSDWEVGDIKIISGNRIAVLANGLWIFNSDGVVVGNHPNVLGETFSIDSTGNYYIAHNTESGSKFYLHKYSESLQFLETHLVKSGKSWHPAMDMSSNKIFVGSGTTVRIIGVDGSIVETIGGYSSAPSNPIYGIAIDRHDNIFVADYDKSEIRKFDNTYSLVSKFGSFGTDLGKLNGVCDLEVGTNDKLYALEEKNNRFQIFDLNGVSFAKVGSFGLSNGQFVNPSGISFNKKNNRIYVADKGNNRIQIFDENGNYIAQFGKEGSFDGEFILPHDVDCLSNGNVIVADFGNKRIQVFDSEGNFLEKKTFYDIFYNILRFEKPWMNVAQDQDLNRPQFIFAGSDGLVYSSAYAEAFYTGFSGYNIIRKESGFPLVVADSGLNPLKTWWVSFDFWKEVDNKTNPRTEREFLNSFYSNGRAAESIAGDLHIIGSDGLARVWKRTFRTVHPEPANALALPIILSQKRRPGTALVDVDYTVKDADNATVQTAALAFKNGGNSLSDVIPITSFADGTGNKLGANIATGQTHRFTWDVARDWSTDFGEVQLEILAKDGRGLLNLDFIQIPAEGNQTALKISRSPLTDKDFLSVWYWLIATGNADIKFEDGRLYEADQSLEKTDKVLASGIMTTEHGRAYLFQKMGLREALPEETTRARDAGTPGVYNWFEPKTRVGPDERPYMINAYGFDVSQPGYWVVPLSGN
jgi:DNA-binding beta-propeller fold protein YncE